MKFAIKNRFTGDVQFTAEIDCAESASDGVKVGLSVRWAMKNGANLARANLEGAYLVGAYLARANLEGANLDGANLEGAYLARANLARANLARANLADANLLGANLEGANLVGANLARAYLDGANLAHANLEDANLARANLERADLDGAYLDGANLEGAHLEGAYLARANLEGAKGIDSYISFGPVGETRRTGYATLHGDTVKIHLGCFCGDLDETCEAIRKKYGDGSSYEGVVRAAVAEMICRRWNVSEAPDKAKTEEMESAQ